MPRSCRWSFTLEPTEWPVVPPAGGRDALRLRPFQVSKAGVKENEMNVRIRLALLLGFVLGVAGLIIGTLGPTHIARPSDSPYISALSDFAVGTAEAVPCHTWCNLVTQNPPYYNCIPAGYSTWYYCHYSLDHTTCETIACPGGPPK